MFMCQQVGKVQGGFAIGSFSTTNKGIGILPVKYMNTTGADAVNIIDSAAQIHYCILTNRVSWQERFISDLLIV